MTREQVRCFSRIRLERGLWNRILSDPGFQRFSQVDRFWFPIVRKLNQSRVVLMGWLEDLGAGEYAEADAP